jgi:hypothetical protein
VILRPSAHAGNRICIRLFLKLIGAIPDWSTALRPDFMARARAGA